MQCYLGASSKDSNATTWQNRAGKDRVSTWGTEECTTERNTSICLKKLMCAYLTTVQCSNRQPMLLTQDAQWATSQVESAMALLHQSISDQFLYEQPPPDHLSAPAHPTPKQEVRSERERKNIEEEKVVKKSCLPLSLTCKHQANYNPALLHIELKQNWAYKHQKAPNKRQKGREQSLGLTSCSVLPPESKHKKVPGKVTWDLFQRWNKVLCKGKKMVKSTPAKFLGNPSQCQHNPDARFQRSASQTSGLQNCSLNHEDKAWWTITFSLLKHCTSRQGRAKGAHTSHWIEDEWCKMYARAQTTRIKEMQQE